MKRKYSKKYTNNPVYKMLEDKIQSFRNSIPMIILLKNGSVTDRHWSKLMNQANCKFQVSIKTMTLDQVFALHLEKHEEAVTEIVNEAIQEFKN